MSRSAYTTVIAVLAACVVVFAGCASQPHWPPISEVATDTRIAPLGVGGDDLR